jgi:signal transduction histidine kinase
MELELQNQQLSEYAHINSHLLRGPLARILGIINLLSKSEATDDQKQYLEHLLKASKDLDEIVTKISDVLEHEGKGYKGINQKRAK